MKTKGTIIQKIASFLALILGVMSVFAGGKVLLGIDTKYYTIINWLVVYNVIFGFISIVAAYFIWKNNTYAKKVTVFIFSMHLLMLLYLKFMSTTVASESIKAMLFRVTVWIIIIFLSILIPKYFKKPKHL